MTTVDAEIAYWVERKATLDALYQDAVSRNAQSTAVPFGGSVQRYGLGEILRMRDEAMLRIDFWRGRKQGVNTALEGRVLRRQV